LGERYRNGSGSKHKRQLPEYLRPIFKASKLERPIVNDDMKDVIAHTLKHLLARF
jgi:hypothetical protein